MHEYRMPDVGSAARRGFVAGLLAVLVRVPLAAVEDDAALRARLDALERALRSGDADALGASVARRGRIHVDLRGLTDGQQVWGAGQLRVAFAELFAERRTSGFALQAATLSRSGEDLAFVRGTWTRAAPGGPVVESVSFTLRLESGDWRVFEIRTAR